MNDVALGREEGVAKNVTIVLIGCVTGTVTRGRGSKIVGNLCDVIYGWSLQTASYPVSRVGCEPSPTMAAAGWKLAILGISVIRGKR